MGDLFTLANLFTLLMLVLLQAVLGFDNLLYISIESKRVPADKQPLVRKLGIGIAIVLRIGLLFAVKSVVDTFENPLFSVHAEPVVTGVFNVYALVVLAGGVFIIYTAIKEIYHMLSIEDIGHAEAKSNNSVAKAVVWIVIMNLVFSFDSILSAMALTDNLAAMATAIVIGGVLMIWLANHVAEFLKRNRLYEILGLFILFIVGIMLLSEGAHKAELHFFGHEIHAMAKSTFYFVIAVLVLIDLAQSRYQRKLAAVRMSETTQRA